MVQAGLDRAAATAARDSQRRELLRGEVTLRVYVEVAQPCIEDPPNHHVEIFGVAVDDGHTEVERSQRFTRIKVTRISG